jgi:hypothetical protein
VWVGGGGGAGFVRERENTGDSKLLDRYSAHQFSLSLNSD